MTRGVAFAIAAILPTPLAHYQFDTAASARALVSRIAGQLDPLTLGRILVVLNGMTLDRIKARVAGQAVLPATADRGERLLAFAAETPTFQKRSDPGAQRVAPGRPARAAADAGE